MNVLKKLKQLLGLDNKLSIIYRVKNKRKKPRANSFYYAVQVEYLDEPMYLLLSQREFNAAHERAIKNPEDLPKYD